ncbi:MAG: hypothetical protein PHZ00_03430 [Candidatus Peribacteraceae bacterium]|nr:hypothetical protein [Candidatus Peribacteraceae bacterium]
MPETPSSPTASSEKGTALSFVDRLAARLCTPQDVACEITQKMYAGLQVHCRIPEGYRHCELGTEMIDLKHIETEPLRQLLEHPPGKIINPQPQQLHAIEFFNMILEGHELVTQGGDPLRPTVGAYLHGPPGVGKTHIMAAFGRSVEAQLATRLEGVMRSVRSLIGTFLREFDQLMEKHHDTPGVKRITITRTGIKEDINPVELFQQRIDVIMKRILENRDQPTDMLYLGFKDLCELFDRRETRKEALDALARAPIVFVDDLDGGSSPAHLDVIRRLIEQRYEVGRFGTFLTTNIDVKQVGGSDENVSKRILSRAKESFAVFDFSECVDWRDAVKHRRIKLIQDEIARRVAEKYPGMGAQS